jgi:hypothetical protein
LLAIIVSALSSPTFFKDLILTTGKQILGKISVRHFHVYKELPVEFCQHPGNSFAQSFTSLDRQVFAFAGIPQRIKETTVSTRMAGHAFCSTLTSRASPSQS